MSELMAPLPVIGKADRYEVFLHWKDGPGGVHYAKSWANALEIAQSLVGSQWSTHYEIRIRHVVTKVWRYEPAALTPAQEAKT